MKFPNTVFKITFDLFQRWRELPDPGLIGSEGGGVKVNVLARVEAAYQGGVCASLGLESLEIYQSIDLTRVQLDVLLGMSPSCRAQSW